MVKTRTRTKAGIGQKRLNWQLQEAKAMLSEVIREAAKAPQIITYRGEEAAVVLSIEKYHEFIRPKMSFYDFIRNSPLYGTDFEIPLMSDNMGFQNPFEDEEDI
jgi:prevent-host-death family protein